MATNDVRILKQSGIIAVRHANGNLRIPGFKLLEHCDTTVDMDKDPEVFMMLEPGLIVPNLNKFVLYSDMRNTARRLRFIFRAVILFFKSRLPDGEKMLHEKGIANLPNEVFYGIKVALAQSDRHFLKFSAMAIKRCLQLFTEIVLDDARTASPTGRGDTTARDLAREAWEAVKQFRAMLSQDRSKNSDLAGPPTASSKNTHVSNFTSPIDLSTSSFARRAMDNWPASPTRATLTPAEIDQGRGVSVRRPTTFYRASAAGMGGERKSFGLNRLDTTNLDARSSSNLATASLTSLQKRDDGSATPSITSALGKHRRAEPDLDATKQRPKYFRNHEHKKSEPARAEGDSEDAQIEQGIDMIKALQEQGVGRYEMTASDQILAREVISLRDRVRSLEQEKEEALAKQRRQLRPGLVTMKMSWRVQERVNQLFGSTDIGTGGDLATGPGLPPIGYFRHPRARKGSETPKSKNVHTKTSGKKSSKSKLSKSKMTRVDEDDSDGDEESDVPTESSWASSIPE